MRSSEETYRKVANRCSSYDKKDCNCKATNSEKSEDKSCLSCKHFSKDEYCKLDLYDPIVKSL